MSKERTHLYTFAVTLLFIFGAASVFVLNTASLTGYATYDSLSSACKNYFGDKVCDDSAADCGSSNYKSGTSLVACDECQTWKDGKQGFNQCEGGWGDVLLEGKTQVYPLAGKNYEVTLDYVSSTTAKFNVNGESILLSIGESEELADGTTITLTDIIYQAKADGIKGAMFTLDAPIGVLDWLNEGSSKTYTINAVDYEVALDFVSSTGTKFNVNGDLTPLLSVGKSSKVAGVLITVKKIEYEGTALGIKRVKFSLDASYESECTDSDGGKNYYVKGQVTASGDPLGQKDKCAYGQGGNPDYMYDKNMLFEAYCFEDGTGDYGYDFYTCPNGCKNDVCVTKSGTSQQASCKDSCGVYSETASCQCDTGCVEYEDCCPDYEEVCGGGVTKCTDSDATNKYPDGKNYYVKGTTYGPDTNPIYNNVNLPDNCDGPNNALTEFYCGNGQIEYDYYECPNGCQKGACSTEEETPQQGSCKDSCGGKSKTGSCYCDTACSKYEDCCSDYQGACSGGTKSCGDGYCSEDEDEDTCPEDCSVGTVITNENTIIMKNDYFIVGSKYKLQYKGADKITADNPVAKFKRADGGTLTLVSGSGGGKIKIGGGSYVFIPATSSPFSDYGIKVDLNGDGKIGGAGTVTPQKNTCQNSCGGKSKTGSCYCDSACEDYGDCCSDYQGACSGAGTVTPPLQQGSCKDSCNGKSKTGSCYCDTKCVDYGDCCSDYQGTCSGTGTKTVPTTPKNSCEDACKEKGMESGNLAKVNCDYFEWEYIPGDFSDAGSGCCCIKE